MSGGLHGWPSHIHVIWELSTPAAEWYRTYSGKLPDLPPALEFYDPGVRRTLASSRRSRRLATLPTPSGPGRLSLYRSAMRSRST